MADKIQRLLLHNAIAKNHERFFFEHFVLRGGWLIYLFLSSLSKPLMLYKYLYSDFRYDIAHFLVSDKSVL